VVVRREDGLMSRSRLFFTLCLSALSLTVLSSLHPLHAQVPATGTFTATQSCSAQRAINGANPGKIMLNPGDRYEVVGFNSDRRTHLLLRIPGASPNRRWVRANCGTFTASDSTPDPGPSDREATNKRRVTLLPFFDRQNNPIRVDNDAKPRDISPPPPSLQPFDRKILELCGATFDAPVSETEFKRLLSFYPDVVQKLKAATNGELKPNRRSDAQFIDDLGTIWFGQKGFKHIFCGELDKGNSIGGLHFYGRYLQFQEQGIAGRIDRLSNGRDAKAEVVEGVIYSFGTAIQQGDRMIAQHPIKGYAYVSNAQEMLVDATRAFKVFNVPDTPESQACLITITDSPSQPFRAVFVKKAGAIRTFYPDATPDETKTLDCEKR
jgi:hypothetical protein